MRKNRFTSSVVAALVLVAAASAQGPNISTVAGGGNPTGAALSAPIGQPWAVAEDGSGNFYISDSHSNRIFKVTAAVTPQISVIAGTTSDGLQGNAGPAISASLSFPTGLAFDQASGALYIADNGNNQIRVVNTNSSGTITVAGVTIAAGNIDVVAGVPGGANCIPGTTPPLCGDTGLATAANLSSPSAVALDSATPPNIYIADTVDNVIRVVNTQASTITINTVSIGSNDINTIAGNYAACTTLPCGDGAASASAQLNLPQGLALDANNNIYVADTGCSTVQIQVVPCTGKNDSAIRFVNTQVGSVTIFGIPVPAGDIATVAGVLGTACTEPGGSSLLCGDGSPSTVGMLNSPIGISLDALTPPNLFIADGGDQTIREVLASTNMFTSGPFAGTYTPCTPLLTPCGDPGLADAALLNSPTGVLVDQATGDVFISDLLDGAVRKVTGGTNISTYAGLQFNRGYFGDGGAATSAEIQLPRGVAVDLAGNLYVADTANNRIRKVSTLGDISTVAGNGVSCLLAVGCGDGGSATAASLQNPGSVFVDAAGTIYIADSSDNAVRAVNTQTTTITVAGVSIGAGEIETVAGQIAANRSIEDYSGDKGAATKATLTAPFGIAVDKAGDIFIADAGNAAIRRVDGNTGIITTVAGTGVAGFSGDKGKATSAKIGNAAGVSVDAVGNIYITDGGAPPTTNNRIRVVNNQTSSITLAGVTIAAGNIDTIAGNDLSCVPAPNLCGDGLAATSAQLASPWAAFIDASGNMFISDQQNHAIRVVNTTKSQTIVSGVTIPAGKIESIAGTLTFPGFLGDGKAAFTALLHAPQGLAVNSAGDLYMVDHQNWRIRKIPGIVATTPTASASPSSLAFSTTQPVGVASAAKTVTITNNGNLAPLAFTIAFTGTDPGDFKETDTCSGTVASNKGTCVLSVTFTPAGAGSRSANMVIADAAAGVTTTVTLTGTGVAGTFTLAAGALSPTSVTAGGSATSTITITSVNDFAAAVALTCSITTSQTPAPTCSLSPTSVTPAANGPKTSVLTVKTTAAIAATAALTPPSMGHGSAPMYAMWLLLPAMLLSTAGMSTTSRRKLFSWMFIVLAVGGILFLVACGGGGGGGGGGTPGTPSGLYTVTVTAKSGSTTLTKNVTLTVN